MKKKLILAAVILIVLTGCKTNSIQRGELVALAESQKVIPPEHYPDDDAYSMGWNDAIDNLTHHLDGHK